MFAGLRKKWRDQIGQTKTILGEKVREALASVVPITLIVLILCFTAAPVPTDVLLAFLVGAVLLIVGMGLFTLGADTAMLPIGERVGAQMTNPGSCGWWCASACLSASSSLFPSRIFRFWRGRCRGSPTPS